MLGLGLYGHAWGSVYHTVSNDKGVTFGELIDAAMHGEGSEGDFDYETANNDAKTGVIGGQTKLADLLETLEKRYGCQARFGQSCIRAAGVVVPTAEEWEQVQ